MTGLSEICISAYQNHISALEFIPEKFITAEMCNNAFDGWANYLAYIPEKYRTPKMRAFAEEMLLSWGREPILHKSYTMRTLIIQISGDALEFIPDELKTPELCRLALKTSKRAIEFIPEKIKEILRREKVISDSASSQRKDL